MSTKKHGEGPARRVAVWAMWKPQRFTLVTLAVAVVALTTVMLYLLGLLNDAVRVTNQLQAAAAEQRATATATAPETTSDTPSATPTAGSATTTPTALPTTTAAPTAPAQADPDQTAKSFLAAWAAGAKAASNEAWIKSVTPFSAPSMLDSLRLADHTAMPADLKPGNVSTTVEGTVATTTADLGAFGKIKLALEPDASGAWKVLSLVPADDH